jgi:hypothetical protein
VTQPQVVLLKHHTASRFDMAVKARLFCTTYSAAGMELFAIWESLKSSLPGPPSWLVWKTPVGRTSCNVRLRDWRYLVQEDDCEDKLDDLGNHHHARRLVLSVQRVRTRVAHQQRDRAVLNRQDRQSDPLRQAAHFTRRKLLKSHNVTVSWLQAERAGLMEWPVLMGVGAWCVWANPTGT